MIGRIDRRTSMLLVLALVALAQNDGYGLARVWIEMGRATPWAEIAAFCTDMAVLVPKVSTASLGDLNFGVTLGAVLQRATKRGIQTSPAISILGKSFSNMEGSVRHLAPELSMVEVFQSELRNIMFELVGQFLSKEQTARTALELMLGATEVTDQLRGVLRDMSNRDLIPRSSQESHRADTRTARRSKATDRALLGMGAAGLWLLSRRKPPHS